MFSGIFTCQEAGVEQSNLRSALDVALKQRGSGKPCHGWGNCLGNMLVTFNIGTLMESLPICKIQSHIETSPCKRMCSIYRSHVPCWFFGARLNLSSTKSIVLTSSRCLQWLDRWKNAELPLCNHGLGFGNLSKTSLFLNRLDQNSDLSDFFWWNIYIYMHICIYIYIYIFFFFKTNCYKVAPKKLYLQILSEVYHSLTKLWSSGGSHAWELGQSHARLLAALRTAAGARPGRKWHEHEINLPLVYARLLCNRLSIYTTGFDAVT